MPMCEPATPDLSQGAGKARGQNQVVTRSRGHQCVPPGFLRTGDPLPRQMAWPVLGTGLGLGGAAEGAARPSARPALLS